MRRYLTIDEIDGALGRECSVEQFLGQVADSGVLGVRHLELRPAKGQIELWLYDSEDLGDENYLDIYSFPSFTPEPPDAPVAVFEDLSSALSFAGAHFSALSDHWVNQSVSQSDYLDFVRAGRPSTWPIA